MSNSDQFGGSPVERPREAVLEDSLSWAHSDLIGTRAALARAESDLAALRDAVEALAGEWEDSAVNMDRPLAARTAFTVCAYRLRALLPGDDASKEG